MDAFLDTNLGHLALTVAQTLALLVPVLIAVAYLTWAERKVLALMQMRKGPNMVGPFGMLQPFADALKLLRDGDRGRVHPLDADDADKIERKAAGMSRLGQQRAGAVEIRALRRELVERGAPAILHGGDGGAEHRAMAADRGLHYSLLVNRQRDGFVRANAIGIQGRPDGNADIPHSVARRTPLAKMLQPTLAVS